MTCTNLVVILSVIGVVLPAFTMAREFWVGDDRGWTKDFDYQAWAKDKVFHVGDKLVFNYTKGAHSVFKVNGTEFTDCIIPPPNTGLTSGNDVVTLASPGKKWYICGVATHCAEHGQKLVITVEGGAPEPAPGTGATPVIFSFGHQILIASAVIFAAMMVA